MRRFSLIIGLLSGVLLTNANGLALWACARESVAQGCCCSAGASKRPCHSAPKKDSCPMMSSSAAKTVAVLPSRATEADPVWVTFDRAPITAPQVVRFARHIPHDAIPPPLYCPVSHAGRSPPLSPSFGA